MKNKKKVLIVYPDMILGGSTTALLAFLRKVDYERVDVDILFLHNGSYRLEELPTQVHVLRDAVEENLIGKRLRIKKLINFVFTGKVFLAFYAAFVRNHGSFFAHFRAAVNQMLARIHCEMSEQITKEYDIAIAYLELWPTAYVAEKVCAKKKIAWVHVNYSAACLNPALDRRFYRKMENIFCVSKECSDEFKSCFPELKERIGWVENCIDADMIREKAECQTELEEIFENENCFRIVTIARIDTYTKGLDRIVAIVKRLKYEGFYFHWYLIGGGQDEAALRKCIKEERIEDRLSLLGAKHNPYPYLLKADLFVLASRTEAKPVTVTEAQILSTPILVTEYAGAYQQMKDCFGCIVSNDENALYERIKKILNGEERLLRTMYKPATINDPLKIFKE